MKREVKYCSKCASNPNSLNMYVTEKAGEYGRGYIIGFSEDLYTCPYCKNEIIDIDIASDDFFTLREISNHNRQLLEAMIELKQKDIIEYELKMSQFRNQAQQQKNNDVVSQKRCPKCGCTDFTPLRKKWSLLTGFATNKVEMVCNKCGTKVK